MNDKLLKILIQKDEVGTPAHKVKQRLDHSFMLKAANHPVRQNSFSGFLSWIFSLKSIGLKTAMAGVIVSFFLVNPNVDISSGNAVYLDSTCVNQSVKIDSSLLHLNTSVASDSVIL